MSHHPYRVNLKTMREKWTSWAKQSLVDSRRGGKKKKRLYGNNRGLLLEDRSEDGEQTETGDIMADRRPICRSDQAEDVESFPPPQWAIDRRRTLTREALWAEKSAGKWRLSLKVTHWLRFRRERLLEWDGMITERERKCKGRLVERLERIPGWSGKLGTNKTLFGWD